MTADRIAEVDDPARGLEQAPAAQHAACRAATMVQREILERGPAAAVLPYDPDRRTVILVRQFRAPVLHAGGPAKLLEAIAGRARRRRAGGMRPPGGAWRRPGLRLGGARAGGGGVVRRRAARRSVIHLFLAAYRRGRPDRRGRRARRGARGHRGAGDRHATDLAGMLERHAIGDLKTLSLAQALRLRHPDLFAKRPDPFRPRWPRRRAHRSGRRAVGSSPRAAGQVGEENPLFHGVGRDDAPRRRIGLHGHLGSLRGGRQVGGAGRAGELPPRSGLTPSPVDARPASGSPRIRSRSPSSTRPSAAAARDHGAHDQKRRLAVRGGGPAARTAIWERVEPGTP